MAKMVVPAYCDDSETAAWSWIWMLRDQGSKRWHPVEIGDPYRARTEPDGAALTAVCLAMCCWPRHHTGKLTHVKAARYNHLEMGRSPCLTLVWTADVLRLQIVDYSVFCLQLQQALQLPRPPDLAGKTQIDYLHATSR